MLMVWVRLLKKKEWWTAQACTPADDLRVVGRTGQPSADSPLGSSAVVTSAAAPAAAPPLVSGAGDGGCIAVVANASGRSG